VSDWNELKRPFRDALIDAFNVDELDAMLRYRCQRELERLTSRNQARTKIVDDVIGHAVRTGWLESLVEAARDERPAHTALQEVTAEVLAGIKEEGRHFYQQPIITEEAGIEGEAILRRQLHPYLETLQRRTHGVPLAALDESGERGGRLALARVFVGLNAGERRFTVELQSDHKSVFTAAIGHLHAERQLILLGDPGSGKSTLLRYVAYCLAGAVRQPQETDWREQLSWPVKVNEHEETHYWTGATPVPVLVVLRDFARLPFDTDDGTAIMDYVCARLAEEGLADSEAPLRELARRGCVLFLLDGVDEVPPDERAAVWGAIKALNRGVYGGNRWVATCRVLSFDKEEAPAGAPVKTLQPFEEPQIVQFIDNWYAGLFESGQLSREQATNKAEALKAAVQRPALFELAQNPMLLTIMALVQTYRGTLPDERAKLYQACVETLLLRWQLRVEGGDSEMPDALRALGTTGEDLERLLWEIAWEAHSKAKDRTRSADIPRWDVIGIAEAHLGGLGKAEHFLEYTEQRAHLLVGHGGRREQVYRFPHRTFQEYLAACHLAAQRRFGLQARALAAEGEAWREVLNLAAGSLTFNQNNREKVLDGVERVLPRRAPDAEDETAWRRVWVAGEMCATVGCQAAERDEVGRELLPRLRDLLVALLENEALTPQQRAEAGDALGALGDPRPGVCTPEPDLIEIPAGDFLYGEDRKTHTIEQPYAIARYPVTEAQFGMFVQEGGYEEPRYWGGEESAGWRWCLSEHSDYRGEGPVTGPEYWQQPRWHGENRPIVGISWYEAQAYCAWLTEESGREYRLPAEEEWERAARDTDGREWAWGNDWKDGIINSDEARVRRTTTVGAFPRGIAACGAQDMSGNVWEWTASSYDDDRSRYVVRGGSWDISRDYARVALRSGYYSFDSGASVGFRLVGPLF